MGDKGRGKKGGIGKSREERRIASKRNGKPEEVMSWWG